MDDVPNSEDEEPATVVVVFPNSELFVAALCAVSPEGAKILVLLFAGCSELALALRPEKRLLPLEAGVPEDWPKSDMVRGAVGGGMQGSYVVYGTVYFACEIASKTFRCPRKLDAGLAGPMTIFGLSTVTNIHRGRRKEQRPLAYWARPTGSFRILRWVRNVPVDYRVRFSGPVTAFTAQCGRDGEREETEWDDKWKG